MAKMHEKGRNGDSMLVHMSPAEVGGLAALAEQHGTSLTINPQTGYPEAFSLESILPAIVGGAATIATGGAASPLLVGALSGATSYATTGSLEKGLLSGLTAGGLSSLGGSLAAEGAGAAAGQGASSAAQAGGQQAIMNAAPKGVMDTAVAAGTKAMPTAGTSGIASLAPTSSFAANNPSYMAAMGDSANSGLSGASSAIAEPTGWQGAVDKFGDMGRGIQSLTKSGGWGDFLKANQKPITAAGMGIAGSASLADEERRREEMEEAREEDKRQGQRDYMGSVNAMRQNYASYGRNMPNTGLTGSENWNPSMLKTFSEGGMAESDMNQIYQDIALSYMDAGRDVPRGMQKYLPQNNKTVQAPRGYGNLFGGIRNAGPFGGMQSNYQQTRNASPMANGIPWGNMGGPFNMGPRYTGLPGLQNRNQDYKPRPFKRIQSGKPSGNRQMVANVADVLQSAGQSQAQPQGQGPAMSGGIPTQAGNPAVADTDALLKQQNMKAGGGEITGPGDGMSDDIMTSINNAEPAALSDGEFVIPADVVSHLGNGSSDAGADKLYAMMDRIRKMRTGKESQAKEVDASKAMPA